jgi:hypothetical protein
MTVTTDLGSGYAPPGVYIAESSNPISNTTGLPPQRLTLLGRGQGSQRATDQVALSTDGYRLSQKGIIVSSVEVIVVSDGSTLAASAYNLTKETVSPAENDYYYRITYVTPASGTTAAVPEGTVVWVSYDYVPLGYHEPSTFVSASDVATRYGRAVNEEGINSPLTLAAEIAFANGATEILIVPLNVLGSGTPLQTRTALQNAYPKIETDYASSVVVPLTDGLDANNTALAATDLRAHLALASNSGYYRIGIFGQPVADTTSPAALVNTTGLTYERLILAYASEGGLIYRSGETGARLTLGHQYLAAAYGGRMMSQGVQESLTRKPISGFQGLASSVGTVVKNSYASSGVALTEMDRQGRLICRHGTTTDRSDLTKSEPSVVRARDTMIALVQNGLDESALIGSPINEDTPISVKSVVAGILEFCTDSAVIVAYGDLAVRVASLNPSVVEVKFAYRPSFPLNYIMVNFSINLNTGLTDLTTNEVV